MTNVYTGPKEINGTRWCPSCSRHMPDVTAVIRGGRTLYRCGGRSPVLRAPCEQCGESRHHAPECEGEPRPETLAQALSRARKLADERLRHRVRRYLEVTLPRQGSQPRGRFCQPCRETPRYPDHHCREHTAYLTGTRLEAERADSDPEAWLDVWRLFFERVDLLLKT